MTKRLSCLPVTLFSVFLLVLVSPLAVVGQENPADEAAPAAQARPVGLVTDWSHNHVIFSDPGTFAEALRSGLTDNGAGAKWMRLTNDPRFVQQRLRRKAAAGGSRVLLRPRDGAASGRGLLGLLAGLGGLQEETPQAAQAAATAPAHSSVQTRRRLELLGGRRERQRGAQHVPGQVHL